MKIVLLLMVVLLIGCSGQVNEQDNMQPPFEDLNEQGDTMSNPIIVIETNKGTIEAELYADKAPITVENILSYVNEGYYDGLIFHRVIPGFMIQGGGFTPDMVQKETKSPITNEADNGLKNSKYTLAMARTQVVDSATSQFFINTADNAFLDNGARDFGYAVFGKVISGTEVVDAIESVTTETRGPHQNVPTSNVVMTKVYVKN